MPIPFMAWTPSLIDVPLRLTETIRAPASPHGKRAIVNRFMSSANFLTGIHEIK
jgi:hypothetical protein